MNLFRDERVKRHLKMMLNNGHTLCFKPVVLKVGIPFDPFFINGNYIHPCFGGESPLECLGVKDGRETKKCENHCSNQYLYYINIFGRPLF